MASNVDVTRSKQSRGLLAVVVVLLLAVAASLVAELAAPPPQPRALEASAPEGADEVAASPLEDDKVASQEDVLIRSRNALVSAEALSQRCRDVSTSLQSLRQPSEVPSSNGSDVSAASSTPLAKGSVASALRELRSLEAQVAETFSNIRKSGQILRRLQPDLGWDHEELLAELPGARERLLVCLLGVVGQVRVSEDRLFPPVEDVNSGRSDHLTAPLLRVEAVAVAEAEADTRQADVQFGLGLYWSDVVLASFAGSDDSNAALAASDAWMAVLVAPLVAALRLLGSTLLPECIASLLPPAPPASPLGLPAGSGVPSETHNWVLDRGGTYAPEALVKAEELLRLGELHQASPSERMDRAAARALRLYRHAKVLALRHHGAAAEWRYRAAARVAVASHRSTLAAHALSRFSYFLMLEGRQSEALHVATEALKRSDDSFAQYLQATLRQRLGELRTTEEVLHAELQLRAAAGTLPSALEAERIHSLAQLVKWHAVSEANSSLWDRFGRCIRLGDVAQVLICTLCSVVFG